MKYFLVRGEIRYIVEAEDAKNAKMKASRELYSIKRDTGAVPCETLIVSDHVVSIRNKKQITDELNTRIDELYSGGWEKGGGH